MSENYVDKKANEPMVLFCLYSDFLASKLRLKHVKPNDGVLERMVKPDVF
jgi:hypothetical protein